jgi:hypothetical protein
VPIPLALGGDADKVATELHRMATAVSHAPRGQGGASAGLDLGAIAGHFGACADTIQKGQVSHAELGSIADHLEAVAGLLRGA